MHLLNYMLKGMAQTPQVLSRSENGRGVRELYLSAVHCDLADLKFQKPEATSYSKPVMHMSCET